MHNYPPEPTNPIWFPQRKQEAYDKDFISYVG